jgi:transcriptional regulator with XRE-family HTH domain
MISQKLKETIKLSEMRAYEIAHLAEMHPTTLSRILNGIEKIEPGDPRVIRLAKVLGLRINECFQEKSAGVN